VSVMTQGLMPAACVRQLLQTLLKIKKVIMQSLMLVQRKKQQLSQQRKSLASLIKIQGQERAVTLLIVQSTPRASVAALLPEYN